MHWSFKRFVSVAECTLLVEGTHAIRHGFVGEDTIAIKSIHFVMSIIVEFMTSVFLYFVETYTNNI